MQSADSVAALLALLMQALRHFRLVYRRFPSILQDTRTLYHERRIFHTMVLPHYTIIHGFLSANGESRDDLYGITLTLLDLQALQPNLDFL